MSTTSEQLLSIKTTQTRKVRGQAVKRDGRDGEWFIVDGDALSLDDAVRKLDQIAPKTTFDYAWTAFLEFPPHSQSLIRYHRCHNKSDHTTLIGVVKKRGNVLYYGSVKKDGNRFYVAQPYVVDWDSMPEHPEEIKKAQEAKDKPKDPNKWDGGLSCPFCAVKITSTAGRTLHVKSQHAEQTTQYFELLTSSKTKSVSKGEFDDDDEDDVVDLIAESDTHDALKCPFCKVVASSTSGRTLHVRGKHPDKYAEYRVKWAI